MADNPRQGVGSGNTIRIGDKKVVFHGTAVASTKDKIEINTVLNDENYKITFSFVHDFGASISLRFSSGETGRNITLDISADFDAITDFAFTDVITLAYTTHASYFMNVAMSFVKDQRGKSVVVNFVICEVASA